MEVQRQYGFYVEACNSELMDRKNKFVFSFFQKKEKNAFKFQVHYQSPQWMQRNAVMRYALCIKAK